MSWVDLFSFSFPLFGALRFWHMRAVRAIAEKYINIEEAHAARVRYRSLLFVIQDILIECQDIFFMQFQTEVFFYPFL